MIRSFRDRETQRVFEQRKSRKLPPEIQGWALQKLLMLDAAETEMDLRSSPSNHFEHLKGERSGEHSIRINRQWRICFRFENGNVFDVAIEDYY